MGPFSNAIAGSGRACTVDVRMLLFALALMLAPLDLRDAGTQLNLDAVRAGVIVRLGEVADDWSIEVTDESKTLVRLRIAPPSAAPFIRTLVLTGEDAPTRERQLSAALALLIENQDIGQTASAEEDPSPAVDPPQEVTPTPDPAPRREPQPIGWLAIGPRLGGNFGSPVALDGGLDLVGGAFLLRQHLRPHALVGWSRSTSEGLDVDGVRLALGLAAGAALGRDGLLWIGGAVRGGVLAAFARAEGNATAWSATLSPQLVLDVRWRHLIVGANLGPQWLIPSMRFVGSGTSFSWGPVRFALGVHIGYVFQN